MRIFTLLALLCTGASLAFAQTPQYTPSNSRLAEKPAWENDITESLKLTSGATYTQTMGREGRKSRVRGGTLKWIIDLEVPEDQLNWPVALEADESRVFTSVMGNGGALSFDRRDLGEVWFSGEGSIVLPLTAQEGEIRLLMESQDIPQAYENGFGRLRLRPATINELVRFELNDANSALRVVNRGPAPLTISVHVQHEDYFGVPLGNEVRTVNIAANSAAALNVPKPTNNPGELYKTRIWATNGQRKTYEYQTTVDGLRINRARPQVLRLTNEWEKVFIPGPHQENPPPAEGWMAPSAEIDEKNYSSHWMWARQKFTIPADWPASQRVQLLLPNFIQYHATVLIDGKPIGEAGAWELPKKFLLPSDLLPGSQHEITLGITDYIVTVAPGVKVPEKGLFSAGNRSVIAPVSTTVPMGIGINCMPEFYPLPALRSENVVIRSYVNGGKRLEVRAEVHNDTGLAQPAQAVRMRVFDQGQQVFDLGNAQVAVAAGQSRDIILQKAWPNPIFWSPENPHLYELRTEILSANGTVIDTRRDRFGFREWGQRDGYFTLNGQILKLHGGSHNYPTSWQWPTRPNPYRILRHVGYRPGPTGSGQTQGIIGTNTADELGYIIKTATGDTNAHGADNFQWSNPTIWERIYTANTAVATTYINSPSVVVWDLANEISFRGPGEADKMGDLFRRIRAFDPTRFVTVGGSYPLVTGAEVVNYHGWGSWQNRSDYFFYHPEERPSYLRDVGYFQHKPVNEPDDKWVKELRESFGPLQFFPGNANGLRHIDKHLALFAEGVYMETVDTFPLFGNDTYLTLAVAPNASDWVVDSASRDLNSLGNRRLAIQNVRQAGFSASMIHVNGGTGRYLLPIASFSWDRKFRFRSGERMQTRFGVHYDLSEPSTAPVVARYRLLDGDHAIAESTSRLPLKPGGIDFVDLDWQLPTVTEDKTLRLEVRVWPQNGTGWFYDDIPITVYAPTALQLPAAQTLSVFDPKNAVVPILTAAKVPFEKLENLSGWNAQTQTLLIGSEGLNSVAAQDLASLAPKVEMGGQIIVLDHFSLPQFLPRSLVQSRDSLSYVATNGDTSPITKGILSEDLRAWTTRERDQVTSWNPLETPAGGAFRVHVTTVGRAPILEVGQGKGRVLFAQLNFKDALGVEPAAERMLGNFLNWTVTPSPFPLAQSAIVSGDEKLAKTLQNRIGLVAQVSQTLDANLIVASGTSQPTLANLQANHAKLKSHLDNGATLFFYGLDEASAQWLSEFTGSPVKLESFPHRYAYLTDVNSQLTAGLGHGDFFISGLGKSFKPNQPLNTTSGTTGNLVISGPKVKNLTRPAYVSEIPVGKGRIVVDLVRSLETPIPSQMRVLSMLLNNAGGYVNPDGNNGADKTRWSFQLLDLTPFVNRSLVDTDDPTKPRGYNGSGSKDDLRDFKTGKQTLRGVDYYITPAEKASGNSVILLAGKNPKLGGVTEVKGIKVGQKAERLYFLHNAAWGVPGFIYRIYYTADRKAWIPGKPDPFVDVVVKPDENITEWVHGGSVENSQKFLAGATVAWLGGNDRTRAGFQGGDKALGVFQMVWDNPNPDKEIESIDILSPGTAGSGNAFVFAITAANRDETPAAGRKPALEAVLPKGVDPAGVLEQVQFPNYGFVLMKDGTISSIYDSKGQPFIGVGPFQAEISGGEPPTKEPLAHQNEVLPKIEGSGSASRRTWTFKASGAAIDWKITITATPGRLRNDLTYTPTKEVKSGFNPQLKTNVGFINGAEAQVVVNGNPITIQTASGDAILSFDTKYTTWVFSYWLNKNYFTMNSPAKNGAPWRLGQEETLWWEITPP